MVSPWHRHPFEVTKKGHLNTSIHYCDSYSVANMTPEKPRCRYAEHRMLCIQDRVEARVENPG